MRMKQEVLAPGVKYAQKTDPRPQMLRVGRNLQERGCAGLEQQAIEHFWIVLAKRIQVVWDREYYMEVGHG
jgi:hypothetical protein